MTTDLSQLPLPSSLPPSSLPPGSKIGMLGSGQLGRMFGLAARQLGYAIHVFSPEKNSPTEQIADHATIAPYEDSEAICNFAKSVDVVTLEFENIPIRTIQKIEQVNNVFPKANILEIAQNRLNEKRTLESIGLPVTPFCEVTHPQQVASQLTEWNSAGVLKTTAWGYDGKGQTKVESAADAEAAWSQLGSLSTTLPAASQSAGLPSAILEKWIPFDAEMSVIGVRNVQGEFQSMGPFRNEHRNHILDVSCSPAGFPEKLMQHAQDVVQKIMQTFDVVGLLCVEFFVQGETLLINEIANRPHNSGHLTIEGHPCSQFEQHVRAVCGLPLGATQPLVPAAMVNLLGDLWSSGEPNWSKALAIPNLHLHLYGKSQPKQGRKMGHITVTAKTTEEAIQKAQHARDLLQN